jgi:O-6-methylguanine DNA methyltransferase
VKSLLSAVPFDVPLQVFSELTAFAADALALVKDVYDGKGASRGLPLAMEHLSVYTRKVLEATALIPVGYVVSYGGVAEAAGGGARAVGNVMATNPFAPVVPCHRVVGAAFTLGGYGGGLDVKRRFLEREKRGYAFQREISVGERKLRVFPVESVLINSVNLSALDVYPSPLYTVSSRELLGIVNDKSEARVNLKSRARCDG